MQICIRVRKCAPVVSNRQSASNVRCQQQSIRMLRNAPFMRIVPKCFAYCKQKVRYKANSSTSTYNLTVSIVFFFLIKNSSLHYPLCVVSSQLLLNTFIYLYFIRASMTVLDSLPFRYKRFRSVNQTSVDKYPFSL